AQQQRDLAHDRARREALGAPAVSKPDEVASPVPAGDPDAVGGREVATALHEQVVEVARKVDARVEAERERAPEPSVDLEEDPLAGGAIPRELEHGDARVPDGP